MSTCENCGTELVAKDWGNGGIVQNGPDGRVHGVEKCLTAQLAARDAEVTRLKRGLGLDRTWPLLDVLAKLADGVEHLLDVHDCDGHGWEEYSRAAKEAREIVAATAPRAEGGEK